MDVDRQGMGVLNESQCLALLDSVRLGRIALTDRAMPMILPVAFARMDADLVFRVGVGALARAAQMSQIVCFEADWMNPELDSSWSVSAIGQLAMVEPAAMARAEQLDLMRWSTNSETLIKLTPQFISGRCRSA